MIKTSSPPAKLTEEGVSQKNCNANHQKKGCPDQQRDKEPIVLRYGICAAGISLKYSIVSNVRLVPENEKITDQRHHSDHSVDQDVECHPHEGDFWQSMLDAAIQESRRH